MFILFGITIICLMSKGSSIIADERQNQTLNVLLTTSVSSKELIIERMRGISKLKIALGIPIMLLMGLIIFFGNVRRYGYYRYNSDFRLEYAYLILVCFFVHLKFLLWFCCWLGLKLKTNRRAIMASFLFMALWIIVPFVPAILCSVFFRSISSYSKDLLKGIAYLSPAMPFGEMFSDGKLSMPAFIVCSFIIFVFYIYFRIRTIMNADKYLRK